MWDDILASQNALATLRRNKRKIVPLAPVDEKVMGSIVSHYRKICGNNTVLVAILLYCFAPQSLIGFKIPFGLRDMIVRVIGCSGSYVSYTKNNVSFLYKKDKNFRKEVNEAEDMVKSVLQKASDGGRERPAGAVA